MRKIKTKFVSLAFKVDFPILSPITFLKIPDDPVKECHAPSQLGLESIQRPQYLDSHLLAVQCSSLVSARPHSEGLYHKAFGDDTDDGMLVTLQTIIGSDLLQHVTST